MVRRVPEEMPAAAHVLMCECMDPEPSSRPSAKEIFRRLTEIHPRDEPFGAQG